MEEISLSSFAAGHAVGVIAGVPQKFDAREVVRRARSRLGEDRYRLLTNNCEHFCEWSAMARANDCISALSRFFSEPEQSISPVLSSSEAMGCPSAPWIGAHSSAWVLGAPSIPRSNALQCN
jgi:Lecithin retinol acyltransferase